MTTAGRVYIVGAGPGAPDLITVRGLRRLRTADVVLFDRLVDPLLVAEAPSGAEKVFVGRAPGQPEDRQERLHGLMIERARAGLAVVRLKGGDPFVFGRGGEEVAALQRAGIDFEVVPGLSSATAVPTHAGIPLTHRGVARSFVVISGHCVDREPDLRAAAVADTAVVLMGVPRIGKLVDGLLREGLAPTTPVAVIERGTMVGERRIDGTLQDIRHRASAAGLRSPATIVVGDVAGARPAADPAPAPGTPLLPDASPAGTAANRDLTMNPSSPAAGGPMMSPSSWKAALADRIPKHLADEIDRYEMELDLRRRDRIDERLFAEVRLRRGVYGQRYDNGQRHDGKRARHLEYPSGSVMKGPNTLWDAPGMQRIKLPFGAMTAEQMECLAEVAEDYSTGVLHVTTRQDVQLHFVHIDDTPDLMRRLAAVGITTREACGNSVRNVTACPLAGVCHEESFDVTPHAEALAAFLLGHPDAQDFGRKFKIAFSGCRDSACGVAAFHDIGFIARTQPTDHGDRRGFEVWVGGGLGPVPHQAKLFAGFVAEDEVLPLAQAVCRVFARRGEKHNRARARLKFLVANLGIDEFRRQVAEERSTLPADPRWTAHLEEGAGRRAAAAPAPRSANSSAGEPDSGPSPGSGTGATESAPARLFEAWASTNVYPQRQPGFVTTTVSLPLGDLSSAQMRGLAALVRSFGAADARTTIEQNIVIRWVPRTRLRRLHAGLLELGLAHSGAGTIVDVTSCPGTDTCKLGIASSRGLAKQLRERLSAADILTDEAVRHLRIKISGCFNSCGQHHVADLGFYGVSRKVNGRTVPHFQLVLGGQWEENASSFGLAVGAVPSKRIPEVVDRLTRWYRDERRGDERFRDFVRRTGKARIRARVQDLMDVPVYDAEPGLYSDWGDPREFTVGDIGIGECAGEVVSRVDFDLAASERRVFEAQLRLDEADFVGAGRLARTAMLQAALALLRFINAPHPVDLTGADPETDADAIVQAFRVHLCDTKLFYDPFAGGKFANYLLARHTQAHGDADTTRAHTDADTTRAHTDADTTRAHTDADTTRAHADADTTRAHADADATRAHVEEAQLFIEASHGCHARLLEQAAAVAAETP